MDALAKTLGVFALILLLARFKVPLSIAVLIGAACIGFLFNLPPESVCAQLGAGAVAPGTLALALITLLVLALSGAMLAAGQFEKIVSLARSFFRRPAVTMAALPALVGLLPMPGGAYFSAPMVESAAAGKGGSAGRLSAINYWFRHIWEYWWPIYPGVLAALQQTGSDFPTFAAFQIPLGLFMAASGLLMFRGAHRDLHATAARPPKETRRRLLGATASIWIIIVVAGPCMAAAKHLPAGLMSRSLQQAVVKFAPMMLGVAAALVWTVWSNHLGGRAMRKILSSRRLYSITFLVICVMVFKYMLDQISVGQKLAGELEGLHVPPVLVVAILPFIAGMVTGLAIGFVGTSFPIVLPMVLATAPAASMPAYVALAYAFGHMGQMLSPLHLCHVMSNRYFNTGFRAVYPELLPSAAATAALAVGYFLLLRHVLG